MRLEDNRIWSCKSKYNFWYLRWRSGVCGSRVDSAGPVVVPGAVVPVAATAAPPAVVAAAAATSWLGLAVGTCGAVAGARGWASAGATGASVVGGWCGGRRPARDLRERPLNESLPLGVGLRVNALLVYDPDRVVFDKTHFFKKLKSGLSCTRKTDH